MQDNQNGNTNDAPQEPQKGITRDELIQQLDAQVEYFEKLPQHEKFSFALNVDLYYFVVLIANILKRKE